MGGARVAWAYVTALVSAVVSGLIVLIATYGSESVCARDDIPCSVAILSSVVILAGTATLGIFARVFRLGWEWWLICAAALVATPLLISVEVAQYVVPCAPALAALATWQGVRRPRWRPWVIGGVAGLAMLVAVLSIVV